MEDEQKRAKKKAQALDGIALLAEAAKDLWICELVNYVFLRNTLTS